MQIMLNISINELFTYKTLLSAVIIIAVVAMLTFYTDWLRKKNEKISNKPKGK